MSKEDSETAIDQKREKSRESIFLGAQLLYEGASAPVTARIRNISSGGMMVDTSKVMRTGLTVTAVIKTIGEVAGRVAWSTENRVGIAFDDPIDPKHARLQIKTDNSAVRYVSVLPKDRRPGLAIR
jgi:hypothetical protein